MISIFFFGAGGSDMAVNLPNTVQSALPVRAEKFVKADLRKPEIADYRRLVGEAIERARRTRGWTNDELSGKVKRDPRQVAKWQTGKERPHMDALFSVDDPLFRNALVIALAELGSGIEIDTTIRVRLKAHA